MSTMRCICCLTIFDYELAGDSIDPCECGRCLVAWPDCPKCGNNRQVWANQDTGRLVCHRAGCHTDLEAL